MLTDFDETFAARDGVLFVTTAGVVTGELAAGAGLNLSSGATLPAVIAAVVAIWIASRQGIPYLVLLVAICAIIAELVMRRTRYGARLYAIGGNPEAARLSGINVQRVIFWNFVIAGFGYGVTGVALTARVSGAIGGTAGLFSTIIAGWANGATGSHPVTREVRA